MGPTEASTAMMLSWPLGSICIPGEQECRTAPISLVTASSESAVSVRLWVVFLYFHIIIDNILIVPFCF